MNYTGRPSISGCRPVLSLYPTHHFCQYLLRIFITFTNSSLFCRAFSTNSRRALRHCFAMPPLPKGEALAGRSGLCWTPEARQDARGRALLAGTAASGQRSLSSCRWPRQRSTTVSEILCFARPDESRPTCQGLPLWGNGDDRRQWRKQGGAVGAAASRMRATAKQTLGAATRPWRGACDETERARPLTNSSGTAIASL